jgi:hypothetical protein
MVLHASTIADVQERGSYLRTLPDCSDRQWEEERSGRCSEQSSTRDLVIVSCQDEERTRTVAATVALTVLGSLALGLVLVAILWESEPHNLLSGSH